MQVSNIGAPSAQVQGSDVIVTFTASLMALITTFGGLNLGSNPLEVVLPGAMSVRLIGKAVNTTGSFDLKVEWNLS